ncbi:redoxin domain protein [Pseudoalteromonas luteoviolacea]|uniref:Redoxin domain protein n=1 Tax=Pseudoalteromonas luteoviolacea TaxID=43657 RepID=A0A1C0TL95_9GAMM|nr:TlpA disulfide reductase family protein [Pseudoalteromonas luteoviolacea]MBQ4812755.1 TlpA family protein disulfide reductase [Pseudoalteromonas luteoviolacea]OCQ19165.1 redoxin domain protein [Pseudoalteromonas luteoviolacea]
MIKRCINTATIGAFCLSIAACGTTESTTPNPTYETYISHGETFKHTHFQDVSGRSIDLSQKPGNKLIILFATWCSDSKRTFNELNASELIHDDTLTILAIGREEKPDALIEFAKNYRVTVPLIADEDRQIYNQYANKGIPRLILLDENNRVVKTLIGESENIIEQVTWN